jgi:hypothetical protein
MNISSIKKFLDYFYQSVISLIKKVSKLLDGETWGKEITGKTQAQMGEKY